MIRRRRERDLSWYAFPPVRRRLPASAILARLVLLAGLAYGVAYATGVVR